VTEVKTRDGQRFRHSERSEESLFVLGNLFIPSLRRVPRPFVSGFEVWGRLSSVHSLRIDPSDVLPVLSIRHSSPVTDHCPLSLLFASASKTPLFSIDNRLPLR
jgi:hypothetical protein